MNPFAAVACMLLPLAAAGLLGGCAGPSGMDPATPHLDLTAAQAGLLREDLDAFEEDAKSLVVSVCDDIIRNGLDNDVRRAALLWKTRMLDRLEDHLKDPDPVVAAADTWVMSLQVLDYLQTGEGSRLFREDQERAIRAARQIADNIEAILRKYANPDAMGRLYAGVKLYADEHRLTGVFQEAEPTAVRLDKSMFGGLQQVLGAPLAPFRTAESVQSGAATFGRFEKTVSDLPQEMRWQAELFLLTLEKNNMAQSALRSLDRISRSTSSFARAAEQLPQTIQQTVEQSTKSTLAAVGGDKTVQSAVGSLDQIGRSAATFAEVAQTLPETVDQCVQKSVASSLDAADKSESVQSALTSFRTLANGVESLARTADGLPASMGRSMADSMPPLVDQIALRVAQLVGLTFVGIAAMIVLSRWLPRRGGKGEKVRRWEGEKVGR